MTDLLRDLRFALRSLRKNPGFAAIAIITMALGIGATTAIFTVVNRVLLAPMVYPDPDRIVVLMNTSPQGSSSVISIPKYVVWRDQTRILDDISAYDTGGLRINLTGRR